MCSDYAALTVKPDRENEVEKEWQHIETHMRYWREKYDMWRNKQSRLKQFRHTFRCCCDVPKFFEFSGFFASQSNSIMLIFIWIMFKLLLPLGIDSSLYPSSLAVIMMSLVCFLCWSNSNNLRFYSSALASAGNCGRVQFSPL